MAPVGGAPSIGSGTPDDFNDEAPALQSEQTLCSNPAVSNVHAVIYLLFSIFHRLSGGTPLSPRVTAMRPVPLWPCVSHGSVRPGAPKDASATPSHV